jgi:hypothetical protein
MKSLVMGPKEGLDAKADWPTDRQKQFKIIATPNAIHFISKEVD